MLSINLINNSLKSVNDKKINSPVSFEETCFQNEVYFLQHRTKLIYLPEILKSGFLLPRSQQEKPHINMGGIGEVVYLQPYFSDPGEDTIAILSNSSWNYTAFGGEKGGDLSNVVLLFDVKLLSDSNDYYANKHWLNRGVKDSNSILPEQIKDIKNSPIKDVSEICFSNPIDLSKYLTQIWVYPTKKDELLQSLKTANVEDVWMNKIFAYAFHPTINCKKTSEKINNEKLTLISIAPNSVTFTPKQTQKDDYCLTPAHRKIM